MFRAKSCYVFYAWQTHGCAATHEPNQYREEKKKNKSHKYNHVRLVILCVCRWELTEVASKDGDVKHSGFVSLLAK